MRILLLSVVAAAFVGCGSGNVDKVKNATLKGFDTMSIGAAVEGSKICADIKYEDISKDGLNAVLLTCAENSEQIAKRNEKLENEYKNALESYNESVKKYDEALKSEIARNEKERDIAIARLQEKLTKSFTKNLSYDEILKISMDNCKANASNITECDDKGILDALASADVKETPKGFWSLKSLLGNFSGIFGYHDEVLTLASRDSVRSGFWHINKPKDAPKAPQAIKSASRQVKFIIKPDGSVDYPRDVFVVIDGNKTEDFRAFSQFYQR